MKAYYYNVPSVLVDGHLLSPRRSETPRATRKERAARAFAEVQRAERSAERANARLRRAQAAHAHALAELDAPIIPPADIARVRRVAASARTKAYRARKRAARASLVAQAVADIV